MAVTFADLDVDWHLVGRDQGCSLYLTMHRFPYNKELPLSTRNPLGWGRLFQPSVLPDRTRLGPEVPLSCTVPIGRRWARNCTQSSLQPSFFVEGVGLWVRGRTPGWVSSSSRPTSPLSLWITTFLNSLTSNYCFASAPVHWLHAIYISIKIQFTSIIADS